MDTKQTMYDVCKRCEHSTFSYDQGRVCSKTNSKPDFEGECEQFVEKESLQQAKNVSTRKASAYQYYGVNPFAEKVVNFYAIISLIFGFLCSFVLITLGVIALCADPSEDAFMYMYMINIAGVFLILIGVFGIFFTLLSWAILKVYVNISRNLFNVNLRLDSIINKGC